MFPRMYGSSKVRVVVFCLICYGLLAAVSVTVTRLFMLLSCFIYRLGEKEIWRVYVGYYYIAISSFTPLCCVYKL